MDLPDVLQFMQVLWAVAHGLERTSKHMASTLHITGPQRLTLRVIGLSPGISAGDLAGVLHVHPSTLTGILQRLFERGLISRVSTPGDRRFALLQLTRKGIRVNRVNRGTVESAVARALHASSRTERSTARRVLARLAAHLDPGQRSLRRRRVVPAGLTRRRRGS